MLQIFLIVLFEHGVQFAAGERRNQGFGRIARNRGGQRGALARWGGRGDGLSPQARFDVVRRQFLELHPLLRRSDFHLTEK